MNEPVKMSKIEPAERKRIYHFSNGCKLELSDVTDICVRPSGTHRLKTGDGRHWIVQPGWVAIELDIDDWCF